MRILAIITFLGIALTQVSKRIHIPDVVLYIAAGIIVGPTVLNIIDFSEYAVINQLILSFGAAYILFDGGREIELKVLNEVKVTIGLLATVGVLISAVVTGFFAWKILNIDFIYALLLGAVIASTDPSVLVPLFKNMNISPKLKQTIISESAFNDAAGAIITFAIVGIAAGGGFSVGGSLLDLLKTAGGGVLVGAIIGYVGNMLVCEGKFGRFRGFTAEMAIASVLAAYVLSESIGVSGFMAAFTVGMICGNKHMFNLKAHEEGHEKHEKFKDVTISLLRMLIFMLLGIQMNFVIISQYWGQALLVILAFVFLARPISVLLTVPLDRKAKWNIREIAYLCWTRETGVIPAALAGMLITMNIPNAQLISAVTSIAIIITLTFQASTAKYFARVLKLEVESKK
ncbi:sodium:proton antiporter [Acetobacterium tundrae]|uniref:Sodium:proton antiporter n=2 Tax=Acetobacterium tundrae TaxID=132932 RepID=A0ABR6WK98_9FIRM|nr:sodium:proton antiporter [Acetobacterium tundrae]